MVALRSASGLFEGFFLMAAQSKGFSKPLYSSVREYKGMGPVVTNHHQTQKEA